MQEYRFKRVETVEHDITVHADSPEQAYARACVGGMDCVRGKEGVEITDCRERSETVKVYGPEQMRVDAYKEFTDYAKRDAFLKECKGVDPNTIFFRIRGQFRVLAYVPREFAERGQMTIA